MNHERNLIGEEIFVGRMFANNKPMIGVITTQSYDKVSGYIIGPKDRKLSTFSLYITEVKRINKKLRREDILNQLGI